MLRVCVILLIMSAGLFVSCAEAQQSSGKVTPHSPDKILIVYLSRTKNTKAVAGMIRDHVGGTLVELELLKPYPENYQRIVQQVSDENASGFLPPLKTKIDNIAQYDLIFLGFPTWGMQLPPPMKSFLSEYNLAGKTVIPFNTNAGYGIGTSFDKVRELCTGCKIPEGFSTQGGIERDGIMFVMKDDRAVEVREEVRLWLKKLKFL